MYFRIRTTAGGVDSARASVVATVPPHIGDEPGDADIPPRPAWVGCYRFSHQPFAANVGVGIDTVVVRLTNDIFFWDAPHVPLYHLEPGPAAVGVVASSTAQGSFTSRWHPIPGDSIRLTWGLPPEVLTADLVPAGDSLRGIIYVLRAESVLPPQRVDVVGTRMQCPSSLSR